MSLRFDRVNTQYMQIGDVGTFKWLHGAENPSAFKWSISFWLKLIDPTYSGFQTVVHTSQLTAGIGAYIAYSNLAPNYQTIYFEIDHGADPLVVQAWAPNYAYPNDSAWHNVVVTYDQSLGTNNVKFYIDGTLVGQGTKSGSPSTANASFPLQLGAAPSPTNPLDGYLEDVRFYKDYVLLSDEVKIIAKDSGHDGIVNSLFARYKLADGYDGEPAGKGVLLLHCDGSEGTNNFVDSSPSAKTVTAVGNVRHVESIKKFGISSARFNGISDYLSLVDSDDWYFGIGDFTIDCWVMLTAYPSVGLTRSICGQYVDNSNWWNFGYRNSSGEYQWRFMIDTTANVYVASTIQLNTWYHVAVVRKGTTWYIFENGILLTTTTDARSLSNLATLLTVGFRTAAIPDRFQGYIDELRITKGAARWVDVFTPPLQPYFTEIAEISGRGLNTLVSSASAPKFRGGELAMKRKYKRW